MRRLLLLLSTALCLYSQNPDRISRIENGLRPAIQVAGEPEVRWTIQQRMAHHKTPAVSIAVINNGKLEWAKAYGSIEAGGSQAANTETMFQAASISKPISALAALRMVAAGKLNLDEDVNSRLTSWKVPPHSFGKTVTLRGLLSHTAGTTVHGFPGYAATAEVATAVQVLNADKPANTAKVVVDIEPGVRMRYSGGGFTIMQVLMSDAAGKPFSAILRELVLEPLNMSRSTFEQPLPERFAVNAARAHRRDGKPIAGRWHTYPEQAAAGLWTTPTDLAKAMMAVQRAHAGETKLLPSAITRQMLTAVKADYGLGWGLGGSGKELSFGHGGSNAGYRCYAWAYAEKGQGAVIMTNSDSGDALRLEIFRGIAAEYGWPEQKAKILTPVTMSADRLGAYAGTYETSRSPMSISVSGKGLRVAFGPQTFDFLPESETTFVPITDGAPNIIFDRNADGKVTGLKAGNVTATRKE